jgi:hypothetical protein
MVNKMEDQTTIKVKFWTYALNCGDGSVFVKFYPTLEAAKAIADKDNERYCDDIDQHELEFDLQGNLLTKNKW